MSRISQKAFNSLLLSLLFTTPVMAADWPVYYSNDGLKDTVSLVTGEPNTKFFLVEGGNLAQRTKKANECGVISVENWTVFNVNGVNYDMATMPTKDPPRCVQGTLSYIGEPAVYDGGYKIYVTGLIPYKPYTVTAGASFKSQNRKSNACGVVTFTGSLTGFMNAWKADFSDYKVNVLNGAINKPAPLCQKGQLFLPN